MPRFHLTKRTERIVGGVIQVVWKRWGVAPDAANAEEACRQFARYTGTPVSLWRAEEVPPLKPVGSIPLKGGTK